MAAAANPSPAEQTDGFVVPDGFVIQELKLARGKVARPKDWFYLEEANTSSVRWVIAKEDPSKGRYETGMTIQLFIKVEEVTKKTPRQFIEETIISRKSSGTVVSECPETIAGTFNRRCLELIEPQTIDGRTVEYRVLYSFLWRDTADFLLATIFGSPPGSWDETAEVRFAMSQITLLSNENSSSTR